MKTPTLEDPKHPPPSRCLWKVISVHPNPIESGMLLPKTLDTHSTLTFHNFISMLNGSYYPVMSGIVGIDIWYRYLGMERGIDT